MKLLFRFLGLGLVAALGCFSARAGTLAEKISQAEWFSPPLAWVSEAAPSDAESQALWKIFSGDTGVSAYEGMQQFVSASPQSPWTPSVRAQLAKMHRSYGRYTRALQEWELAWQETKALTNATGRSVAEFTLGNWSQLLASLGRTDKLAELFGETAGWRWQNAEAEALFAQSREGYDTMLNYPGVSYRCGTMALARVAERLGHVRGRSFPLIDLASPSNGFCLSKLVELSESNRLGLVAVERTAGTQVVIPSVIHWRQNHYAAVLGKKGPQFWVADPTFGNGRWIAEDFLNEEASGKFLVPATNVPAGWKRLAQADTDAVFGKGQPSTIHHWEDRGCNISPGGPGAPASGAAHPGGNQAVCLSCQGDGEGMPVWWVSEPYLNLFVADTPLSYFQSDGGRWSFRWTYKQRDHYPLDTTFYSTGGLLPRETGMTNANWTHNFLSFIRFRDTYWDSFPNHCQVLFGPNYGDYEAVVYLPGGGVLRFERNSVTGGPVILTNGASGMRLESLNASPTMGGNSSCADAASTAGFRLVYPDGSQDLYNNASRRSPLCFGGIGFSEAVAFLTMRIDPQGRTNSLCYETQLVTNGAGQVQSFFRIKQIIDPDGRTNSLSYSNTSFLNLPTRLTDAHGRKAYFGYDGSGRLNLLADTAGLTNTISYQNNGQGFITGIGTPYGTTTFTHYDAPDSQSNTNQGNAGGHDRINKFISVLDRDSSREVYMYRYESSFQPNSYPTNEVPSVSGNTFDNGTATGSGAVAGLRFRNSFYWGKRQMTLVSNNNPTNFVSGDYLYARLRHWLDQEPISGDTGTLISDRISLERAPTPDGTSEGFKTWYDYYGKSSTYRVGVGALIGTVAVVLPDGTTQFTSYGYQDTYLGPQKPFVRSRASSVTLLGALNARSDAYTYAANGVDLLAHTFPDSSVERFFWDANHQLLIQTNAVGEVTTFTHHERRLATITWPNLTSRTFAFTNDALPVTDPNARMISAFTDSPQGRMVRFPIWSSGLPQKIIGDRGLEMTNTFDGLNRLTSQRYSDGTFISNRYDKLDLSATKDRSTNWTYFGYDSLRRLTTFTDANSNKTTHGYCGCGSWDSTTDALTNTAAVSYRYAQGHPGLITLPDGTYLLYFYDALDRPALKGVSSLSGVLQPRYFNYNNQGLIESIHTSAGPLATVLYDVRDRPAQVTDAAGVTVTNTFDALGRLRSRAYPDGGVERFAYNTNGLVFHTNALGAVTRYAYDGAGRLSAVTNANLEVTRFTYDAAGDLRELVDGKNQTNRWSYDVFGRVTNQVNASGQTVFTYAYDANDRLTNRWTPAKGNTAFTYDPVGNLRAVNYPNSPDLAFDYDPLNRVRQMTDAAGTTVFAFTKIGQLASEDGPWSNDLLTNVYAQQLRSSSTLGTTWTNTYAYDNARRVSGVTSGAGNFGQQFVGASDLRSRSTLPNGAAITNVFDVMAQLTNTTLVHSSATVLNSHEYDYNAWGQRAFNRFKDGSRDEYEYDNIGQLRMAITYASNNAALLRFLQYGYDQAGNLAFRTNDLTTARAFVTDRLNQLTNYGLAGTITVSGVTTPNATNVTVNGVLATLNTNDGTYTASVPVNGSNSLTAIGLELYGRRATNTVTIGAALQYDANGSLIYDGQRGWAYDDENQLTSITQTNAWKTEWTYDGFGRRRIRKEYAWTSGSWNQTNETRYVFDGLLVLQERDASNNPTVTYTRGLDLSGTMDGAGGIGGLLARTDASGSAYYHADAGGNITALINSSQNLVAEYRYDPFGNILSAVGSLSGVNEMQFSSQPYYGKARVNLFHARPYSASLGRFIQADPIGFAGGNNLHRFVGNDPVNEVDPWGWSDFNRPPDSANGGGGVRYPHPAPDPAMSRLSDPLTPILLPLQWLDDGWDWTRSQLRESRNPFLQNLSGTMELWTYIDTAGAIGMLKASGKCLVTKVVANEAHNAADLVRLNKSLASQQQLGEVGEIMAGKGARAAFRDAELAAQKYGGDASDWVKKTSSSYSRNGATFETHWVENTRTGQRVEFKTKFPE